MGGFGNSDEAEAIEELLQAYDQSDADKIKTIVAKPLFRNLENEVCSYGYSSSYLFSLFAAKLITEHFEMHWKYALLCQTF